MSIVLEIGTKNYSDDALAIKKAMSHLESLVGEYAGYVLSEPSTKFGWTFFKLAFKANLQMGIEKEFSDMLQKYRWSDQSQKFAKFIEDYFHSRNCKIKVKIVD